ncbi:MAG: EVE domain-containing protein [Methanothrix sp.]|uniref:EVE domain-containing protein n=1 Tax=Methanothrix sp. TaxID=90426 RepID=UPI0032AE97F4|nr:EVE domain-containing protein [Methanothrix sp.]
MRNVGYSIEELLFALNNMRPLELPSDFFSSIQKLVRKSAKTKERDLILYLRKVFENDVSRISLVLNYVFPEKYFFYRVSMLEDEIFSGLKFFADIVDEFNLPFSKIGKGKHSFDNYIKLNEVLHIFADKNWPDEDPKTVQQRVHYFLYHGLGRTFLTTNYYNRYWIMATSEPYFEALDAEPDTVWSGRKEMKEGDLVFMYRQAPRKAITDIYRVQEDPWFDPYGGWEGFWVPLKKITPIRDITMGEMKHDAILKQWSFVRVQSQGVSTAQIPYFAYNRLLDLIDKDIKEKFNLKPEITSCAPQINNIVEFEDEKEFEDKIIEPLLKRWGFKHQRQVSYDFMTSQPHTCHIDYLVKDNDNTDITIIENKIRIANEKELNRAVAQAKTYALLLGMGGFVVAAPEGFWIYKLEKNKEVLLDYITFDMDDKNIDKMKSLILNLKT